MDQQTRPSGGEFRHAWTVILAAAIGVGLGTTGLPIYTIGQFMLPLQTAFGWSRSEIASGLLCLTVVGVVMAPLVGVMAERFGVRVVAITAMVGLAIGYASLALNRGSIALYDAGWALLAFLGAGTSPIVWTRAVASWFDRRRGLALGLTLCGTGVVAMIAPGIVGSVIAAHGWQAGFLLLAAAQIVIGLPVVFFLFRARDTGSLATQQIPTGGVLLAQAVRGRRFWQMAAAFFLIAIVVGGMIVHLPAMLADLGLPRTAAERALGFLGVALIVGRLSIGALMDRFPARVVAPVFILLPVFSCLLLLRGGGTVPAVILSGLSAGAEVDLLAYLVSRYFGIMHYARIYGWMLAAFSGGVGLGPVFAGWVHDRTGGYAGALGAFVVLMLAAAMLIGTLGRVDIAATRPGSSAG
ncbi:MAG TPA: MFS transporter [Rhodopila sp.]|nr:MFS transporter [Rhodopila sp.]